jgi:aspartyl-tRNA(Asn)/glutamyl-tRNA(Gln) amidotransferase subunit A
MKMTTPDSNSMCALSIMQMRDGLLSGMFTSETLVQAHLDRIEETNKLFNSFITIDSEGALRVAKDADLAIKTKGEKTPILTGIPVGIKDLIVTENIRTTAGSKILENFIPPYDATTIKKLREAGAVIIGKLNLDEFGMGSSNEQSAYGCVRNPWDTERVSGGSSGGSAVAVSIGQVPISLGTDTGGSIRQPASLSGVVGIRPTYGRVSRYGGIAYASSLDQIGTFGRSVEDTAISLQVISGVDPKDSTSMAVNVPDYLSELRASKGKGLKGIRVGVPREFFVDGMSPDVRTNIENSLKTLEKLGATLVEISLPHMEYSLAVYYIVAPAEASSNLARYDGVKYGYRTNKPASLSEMYAKTRAEGFGAEVKRRILIGTYVLSAGYYDAYYKKAQAARTLITNDFKLAFNNSCDVIAGPVSPTTAFKIGEKTTSPLEMYLADIFTIPVNLAGLPGLSVPSGFDSKKLPIGLQLIGPAFSESLLFRVGQEFSDAVEFPLNEKAMAGAVS